jgi:hypothetical protein
MAKHHGGCHCGAVRYTVDVDLTQPAITCNCSICGRSGTVLSFVPATMFQLEKGEGALTSYQFNRKHIDHVFCSTCGIKSFAKGAMPDGTPMIAVNVRCLDDVDLGSVPTNAFDGKSL